MSTQQIPLRFVPVGYGYVMCVNRVIAVLVPDTAPSKRRLSEARKRKHFIDMTGGHAVRSLLLLDDGQVVGCGLSSKVIVARLNAVETIEVGEE